jgi:hypothetical protein
MRLFPTIQPIAKSAWRRSARGVDVHRSGRKLNARAKRAGAAESIGSDVIAHSPHRRGTSIPPTGEISPCKTIRIGSDSALNFTVGEDDEVLADRFSRMVMGFSVSAF